MWFKQFRIKNYRSIVDTGWRQLASDNITGLIGQNESGKTSILEGLNSFYNGIISDDILRSDLSLPVVSCSFSISKAEMKKFFSEKKVPEKILNLVLKTRQITLTRTWNDDKSSYLSFGDEPVSEYYRELEDRQKAFEEKTQEELQSVIDEAKKAEEDLGSILMDKEETQKELLNLGPKLSKARKSHGKNPTKEIHNLLQKLLIEEERLKKRLEKKKGTFESRSQKLSDLADKSRFAQLCLETLDDLDEARLLWKGSYRDLSDLQNYFDSLQTDREIKGIKGKLDMSNANHLENDMRLEKAVKRASFRLAVTSRILKGMDPSESEDVVEKEIRKQNAYYSEIELADQSFKHIPIFELNP